MVRDANNQMFPIAWAVVRVENKFNWMWFLSLPRDDLNLEDDAALQSYLMLIRLWLNSRIFIARGKPIITMLEEIRIYLMQIVYAMHKLDMDLDDTITPSIKRLMEIKKKAQSWIEAYQYGIKPIFGPKMWKPSNLPKSLPPIERKMPGRPRTKRIRHPTKDENKVSKKKRSAKQVTKPALKKSKMGATIKKVHKISAEEHAILMDEEALRETRLDEQKEKEEQQRIRQIWREVEEADREFDTYANEFKD
nr:hypothetical protein [Tanacetum cinerariifolium]